MGSDFCACQQFFNNEKESNMLSNGQQNSNESHEKKDGYQFKKAMEKDTLGEKDNKINFKDINSNKNEYFGKPSSFRDTNNTNTVKKSFFNLSQNNNDDNSKKSNGNISTKNNNNNMNNNKNYMMNNNGINEEKTYGKFQGGRSEFFLLYFL